VIKHALAAYQELVVELLLSFCQAYNFPSP